MTAGDFAEFMAAAEPRLRVKKNPVEHQFRVGQSCGRRAMRDGHRQFRLGRLGLGLAPHRIASATNRLIRRPCREECRQTLEQQLDAERGPGIVSRQRLPDNLCDDGA
jgi:hypothetical protein